VRNFTACREAGGLTINDIGPAHAVYFATYEAVKHYMGGNAGAHQEHHPLAAGTDLSCIYEPVIY
jgi:hypothetical protein